MDTAMLGGLVAGLALFLLGLLLLSDALNAVASDRVRLWLGRAAGGPVSGLIAGFVVTVLLDSSSAVCILVVGLVNARLLSLRHALPVILGANVGTTVGGQILAFNLEAWAPAVMLLGLGLRLLPAQFETAKTGAVVLALGVLFFGLGHMGDAVAPLKTHPEAAAYFAGLSSPWKGITAGALFTLVIQSSSATVGMAIKLVGEGVLPLAAGVAIMLGADIGTTSDVFVAGAFRAGAAFKAALFQVLFNVVTVAAAAFFIPQLQAAGEWMAGAGHPARALANAHLVFNALGALLFLPWTNQIALFLEPLGHGGRVAAHPAPSGA